MKLRVESHGSVVLLTPEDEEARAWFESNVRVEDWQRVGAAIAAEPRTVAPLVEGFVNDGGEVL